jgi:putative copper resistance protein D
LPAARRGALAGVALVTIGLWMALPPLSVDAYPTTFRRTTVPYQASSIAHGEALYRSHCALCHGAAGWGDGRAARGFRRGPPISPRPTPRSTRRATCTGGSPTGIPAAGMPAFGAVLGEDDRWDLINYIRGLASGEQGRMLSPAIEPNRPRSGRAGRYVRRRTGALADPQGLSRREDRTARLV